MPRETIADYESSEVRVSVITMPMERELAELIVSALDLDMPPDSIEPDAPLFGEGLGLDSIDALEISLEVSKQYGIEIKAEDERNGHIFASLRSLAAFVAQHSAK
jgi:acyl carrier protein